MPDSTIIITTLGDLPSWADTQIRELFAAAIAGRYAFTLLRSDGAFTTLKYTPAALTQPPPTTSTSTTPRIVPPRSNADVQAALNTQIDSVIEASKDPAFIQQQAAAKATWDARLPEIKAALGLS